MGGGLGGVRVEFLKAALINAVAGLVSGQHDTFLPEDLRAPGPAISLRTSQEVVVRRDPKVHDGIHFQTYLG